MAKILLTVELNVAKSDKQLKALKNTVTALAKAFNEIEPNKDLTDQLNALAKSLNAVTRSTYANVAATKVSLKKDKDSAKAAKDRALAEEALSRAKQLSSKDDVEKARQATEAAKQDTEAAKQATERAKAENQLAAAEEKRAKAEKIRNGESTPKTTAYDNAVSSVATSIKSAAISGAISLARNAVDSMNETVIATENAVVEIKRVLNEDIADKEISDTLYHLAQDYGQTFENASTLAIKFAQSGRTWTESIQATEAALIALDVAELDVDQASSGLIAIMAQYNIEASDLELVIDKLNKTADNSAVATEALVAGLSRTGSTATQTNLTLDDTIATLTALSKSTGRSGESLGTALNALLNYSNKDSALNVFASLSDDMAQLVAQYKAGAKSMLDVWRGVSEEMEHLSDAQADLLDSYFDTAEGSALKQELEAELGDIYNDMSGVYSTANTFRKNYFIALLNNMDEVDKVQSLLNEASGYSRQELQQYMDTLTAQTNTLSGKWKEMITDTSWLTFKKHLNDWAVKALEILEAFGGIRTAVVVIGSIGLPVVVAALIKIGREVKAILTTVNVGSKTAGGWVAIIGLIANLINIIYTAFQNWGDTSDTVTENLTSNWETLKESTAQLFKLQREHDELAAKTALSTEEATKFKDVQSELVEILGTKAKVLNTLTQGTEEYTQKLQQLTAQEIKERAGEAFVNASNAKDEYYNYDYSRKAYSDLAVPTGYETFFVNAAEKPQDLHTGKKSQLSEALFEGTTTHLNNAKEIKLAEGLTPANLYIAAQAIADSNSGDVKAEIQALANEAATETKKYIQAQMESAFYNRILKDGYEGFDSEEYAEAFLNMFWSNRFGGISGNDERLIEAFYDYAKGALIELMEGVGATGYENVNKVSSAQETLNKQTEDLAALWETVGENIRAAKTELEEAATLEAKQNAILEAQLKLQEAIAEARKSYLKGVLEDYVDELDEAATLEEKQNAVIEARQKLLEAQHNRNVRVYNAKTGQWEWQANPSDVNSAEDNMQQAVDSLHDYLKNQAVKEIKELITSGNYSVGGIQSILDKWLGYGNGDSELETWADGLVSALSAAIKSGYYDVSKTESARSTLASAEEQLKSHWAEKLWDEIDKMLTDGVQSYSAYKTVLDKYAAYGVDQAIIDKILSLLPTTTLTANKKPNSISNGLRENATTTKIYDNGGILEGLGGIKATTEPETVLDPAITRKILSPDSSTRFETFAKSLGIMFEVSKHNFIPAHVTATAPVNNDSRTYTINGVPITAETARKYTVTELFEKMDLFDNTI